MFIVSGRIEYGIAKHFRCSFLRLCSRVCVCVCVCIVLRGRKMEGSG